MNRLPVFTVLLLLLGVGLSFVGQVTTSKADELLDQPAEKLKPRWQGFEYASDRDQRLLTTIVEFGDGMWSLPTPFANITSVHIGSPPLLGDPLSFEFNNDATKIAILLPKPKLGQTSMSVTLQTAEQTQQTADGQIVFSALDASVDGETAKLETQPGNHRIGFWSDPSDVVRWDYLASRTGTYHVTLTYSKAGADGTEVALEMAGKILKTKLAATGSWYRYSTIPVGNLEIEKEGKLPLVVKCENLTGGAVMNLKAVTFTPACEGQQPVQRDNGTILLHARDSTIAGVKLRWEPNPKKITVGYWANVQDRVYWDFIVNRPGEFDFEMLQGCGPGHGGSQIEFRFSRPESGQQHASLPYTVEDTGHWQNFQPRSAGKVTMDKTGLWRLTVVARHKAKGAVMDLRQVKLTLVD